MVNLIYYIIHVGYNNVFGITKSWLCLYGYGKVDGIYRYLQPL